MRKMLILLLVALLHRLDRALAAPYFESLAVRQQLAVLNRKTPRPRLHPSDRWFWVLISRFWPDWRDALAIVKPATVIGWHRKGFRLFWTWKSRSLRSGRPPVSREVRDLIRRMCRENPLWGAPRIHGELLKLGFKVSERTVSRYILRHPKPPSQTWRTFLENHVGCLASMDLFVVPTAAFRLLYGFIILRHDRRRIVHFGVTEHPTAIWIAHQITEVFPWDTAPLYMIRDRDGVYGKAARERLAVEGPAGEGLPTVWTTGSRGASSGSPAPRLCDAELQMPELREKVAALREGGEMPEHWAEQLRDFYLLACLNCGAISDFEFTTDAFGGLCGSEWEEMMRTMRPKFHRPSWSSALILVMASSDLTLPYGRIVHDYRA